MALYVSRKSGKIEGFIRFVKIFKLFNEDGFKYIWVPDILILMNPEDYLTCNNPPMNSKIWSIECFRNKKIQKLLKKYLKKLCFPESSFVLIYI